jgi:serine/threonine protein kinase/tetratricopeptide (TPR) repeat protein
MDTDRNLLFGVLALQADLIDSAQFVQACTLWANQKQTLLADLLVKHGWLTPEEQNDVERLLARKLKKHGGDVRASLAEVTIDSVRQSLAAVADPGIRQSLAGLTTPPAPGPVLLSTTDHIPEAREHYTLSRLHATGGIGRVWLAHDATLGRDVALKELRPERVSDPSVSARFLKEAQVTGQLEHPGVVPIYEVLRRPSDQSPFYTMRFVRGRTLAEAAAAYHQRLARREAGRLELRELLGAFVGICNAVAYAHSRGVLHRDLKPQNVVLGDYGEVVVLDWGLAKLMNQAEADVEAAPPVMASSEAEATVHGQVLGTPAYMAPEQAEGRLDLLGPATDTYGLGAILYEILAGQPPFTGAETATVLRQVVHKPPARPSTLASAVPPALEAICLKALTKKPSQRYGTAKELANDVEHWLADEPVAVYRDPVLVRLGRWARKHRKTVAVSGALLQTAVVVLAVSVILISRSRAQVDRERRRAEAVNAFLVKDLLAQADPRANPAGENLTVRALLDKAAEALETSASIKGNPEVEAAVRSAIGNTYFELGLLQRAHDQLEQAVACQDRVADLPVAERVFTKNRLCWVNYRLGSFDDQMARQMLAQARAELGPDHEETVYAADTLATILLGRRTPSRSKSGAVTGLSFMPDPEAFSLYRENLATQRRVLGPDHPLTIRAALNLADALMSNQVGDDPKNLAEALEVMLATQDAARHLGADHPEWLHFADALGYLYARQGKFAQALGVLAPLQEHFVKVFGPDHLDVGRHDEYVGLAEEGLGHLDTAEALLLKSHAIRKSRLGDGHAVTRRVVAYLARVCMARGKTEEAMAWLRTLLTTGVARTGHLARATDAPAPPGLADISLLGDALAGKAEPIASESLLKELSETLSWLLGQRDWLHAHVVVLQGNVQVRLGRPSNWSAYAIKDAVAVMEANPTTPPRILAEARAALKRVPAADAKQPPPR